MLFPVRIVIRQECWKPRYVTDITVEAFWRQWHFSFTRPWKETDRDHHFRRGWV